MIEPRDGSDPLSRGLLSATTKMYSRLLLVQITTYTAGLVGLCLSLSHVLTFIEFNWPYLLPAANQQTACSSESERFDNLFRYRNQYRLWMPFLP